MVSNQVSKSPPSAADRELAKLALTATDWDSVYIGRKFNLRVVSDTRDELERSKVPLARFEPKLDGSLSAKVRAHLNTIGCAMRPDLSPDQARSWVDALMIKLADLPPNVAAKATERALHVAFQFPSEVEIKLRELAQEHMDRIDQAVRRMDAVMAAIHEAMHPKPRLAEPDPVRPGEKVIDDELVHKLQRGGGMSTAIVNLGQSLGFVQEDQLLPPDDPTLPQEETRDAE